MSKVADLLKRVSIFDGELAKELESEIRRLGKLPPKPSIEELDFLLSRGLISKREVLRRTHPEKSEEDIGELLQEAQREPYSVPHTLGQPYITWTSTGTGDAPSNPGGTVDNPYPFRGGGYYIVSSDGAKGVFGNETSSDIIIYSEWDKIGV
ncbi:MAG: hypothetical protein GF334_12705 [Candidatus Altiarchaeales archaeon]|nr:hypothetical protein [Candidatus Altiarchaeales archaeon]